MDFLDVFGGFVDERVHLGLGEVDHRAGAHGVYFFVTTLVEGFDVAELMAQGEWAGTLSRRGRAVCGPPNAVVDGNAAPLYSGLAAPRARAMTPAGKGRARRPW